MTAYRKRNRDGHFAEQWDSAIADAIDMLHARAWKSAVEGDLVPVYQCGKLVGHITAYSERLAELLLKAHLPDLFGLKRAETQTGSPPQRVATSEEVLSRVQTALSTIRRPGSPTKGSV